MEYLCLFVCLFVCKFHGVGLQKGNLHSCSCHTTPDKGAKNQKQMRLKPMEYIMCDFDCQNDTILWCRVGVIHWCGFGVILWSQFAKGKFTQLSMSYNIR